MKNGTYGRLLAYRSLLSLMSLSSLRNTREFYYIPIPPSTLSVAPVM